MQLKDLQTFCRIAELGNLHAAAQALGVTQPAISKAVRRLESELNVQLLERTSRGVALTEFGHALLPRARSLRQVVDEARTEIADMKTGHAGKLRLGAVPTIVEPAIVPMLSTALGQLDAVQFVVNVHMSDMLLRDLQAGLLDFALAVIPDTVPDDLTCVPLWRQHAYVVLRQGHHLQGRPFALKELAAQKWILPSSHIILRTWVDAMFTDAGLSPPEVFVETDASPAMFAALVRKSDLLTVMTADSLNSGMGTGLAALPAPAGSRVTPLGLFWRRSAYFSKLMERCKESLLQLADVRRSLERSSPDSFALPEQ